jgi:hypothetical protein
MLKAQSKYIETYHELTWNNEPANIGYNYNRQNILIKIDIYIYTN